MLMIEYDNRQKNRLLVDGAATLQTQLRHINIHSHWPKQEFSMPINSYLLSWYSDGLTRALSATNRKSLVEMTGLEDQRERLDDRREPLASIKGRRPERCFSTARSR